MSSRRYIGRICGNYMVPAGNFCEPVGLHRPRTGRQGRVARHCASRSSAHLRKYPRRWRSRPERRSAAPAQWRRCRCRDRGCGIRLAARPSAADERQHRLDQRFGIRPRLQRFRRQTTAANRRIRDSRGCDAPARRRARRRKAASIAATAPASTARSGSAMACVRVGAGKMFDDQPRIERRIGDAGRGKPLPRFPQQRPERACGQVVSHRRRYRRAASTGARRSARRSLRRARRPSPGRACRASG